ncbi:MAG: ABC transporter ATP-binding protein [Acidimicrobiia bacterium]|nr:ABC transporter ATP-binding protein [Acidimicrobiia bacterium]
MVDEDRRPDQRDSSVLLTVSGLCAGYLGEDVVHDVNLTVARGEAVAVIGSNGAGKTTMLKAICGLIGPSAGNIGFDGAELAGARAHLVVRAGMVYVPAERNLFPRMAVQENLYLGSYPKRPDLDRLELVFQTFPRLKERARQHAGTLSGGEQQMLAVGRALMSSPSLLVLDEPTTGLSPILAQEAYGALAALLQDGLTVLVAEQQVPLALDLAHRAYVLDHGRITLSGTSAELARDPAVRQAYLGV